MEPSNSISSLKNIHEKRDAFTLKLAHELFPRKELIALWLMYEKFYERALATRIIRKDVFDNNFFTRRFIVKEIVDMMNEYLPLSMNGRGEFSVVRNFLISLIPFLIDEELPKVEDVETIPATTNAIVLPYNDSGSSCFCDVILVAMFVATNAYDSILASHKKALEFRWIDKYLEFQRGNIPWIKNISIDIVNTACYELPKEKEGVPKEIENTERKITVITDKLKGIVKKIRKYEGTESLRTKQGNIGELISEFRIFVSQLCKRGDPIGQDDAAVFFRSILEIAGWQRFYFPILYTVRTDSFLHYKNDANILESIQPWVRVLIQAPNIPLLEFKEGFKDGDTLQKLIDANFMAKEDESALHTPASSADTFFEYLETQDPDLVSANETTLLRDGFGILTALSTRIARMPDLTVFSVRRGIPSRLGVSGERIKTRVVLPDGELITFPVLEQPRGSRFRNRFDYRIVAFVCHKGPSIQGGHYYLYFKINGGDKWYLYDDLSPAWNEVKLREGSNVTFGSHKDFIERNAYLFWAERF